MDNVLQYKQTGDKNCRVYYIGIQCGCSKNKQGTEQEVPCGDSSFIAKSTSCFTGSSCALESKLSIIHMVLLLPKTCTVSVRMKYPFSWGIRRSACVKILSSP